MGGRSLLFLCMPGTWIKTPFMSFFMMKNDPDELTNLATDPKHASVLRRLQKRRMPWCRIMRGASKVISAYDSFLFQIDWGEGNDGPPPLGVDHEFPALLDCLKIRRHPVDLKESILLDVNLMAAGRACQPHCLPIHSHDHAADGVVV